MSNFEDKSALDQALKTLHRYVRSMYISVDLPEIDNTALETYFNCDDTAELAQFEKMIKCAAVDAIYNDPDIKNEYKANVARKASQELVDAFRGAKMEYEYASGKYGSGQQSIERYEEEKKKITLCRKAANLDKAKAFFKRIINKAPRQLTKKAAKEGVKVALATAGFATGGPVVAILAYATGLAVDAIWYFTPKSVKEKIKEKSMDIAQKAVAVVENIGKKIAATPVVRKAKEVVKTYVAPIVQPVWEKAKDLASKAKSSLNKHWKNLKAAFC